MINESTLKRIIIVKFLIGLFIFTTSYLVGVYQTNDLNYNQDDEYLAKTQETINNKINKYSDNQSTLNLVWNSLQDIPNFIKSFLSIVVLNSFKEGFEYITETLLGEKLFNSLSNTVLFKIIYIIISFIDYLIVGFVLLYSYKIISSIIPFIKK